MELLVSKNDDDAGETLATAYFQEECNNGFRAYTVNIWEEGIEIPGKTYRLNLLTRMNFSEAGVCTCPTCHQDDDDDAET